MGLVITATKCHSKKVKFRVGGADTDGSLLPTVKNPAAFGTTTWSTHLWARMGPSRTGREADQGFRPTKLGES